MRNAVIDIGTNSTRLCVADIIDNKQSTVTKMLSTTRLGEGILNSDRMLDAPMNRTANAVSDFVTIAKEKGAQNIYIYATAVVRESVNKEDFKKLIFEKTGIELHIISGELEGEIAFIGASQDFCSPAVIDIGGGSTEVVTKENGILKALSQKTGGVRLKEQFMTQSGIVDIAPVKAFVKNTYLDDYRTHTDILSSKNLIGVSGTPFTLAALAMGIKEYAPHKLQNVILEKSVLDDELLKLATMTSEARLTYSGYFASRADIIVFGGCILSAFMEHYNFNKLIVSDRDSLEGYLELKNR